MDAEKNEFSAPKLEVYRRRDRPSTNFGQPAFYNKKTMTAMDELFAEIKKLTPTRSNDMWDLFFMVNRGPIEDYGDYDELHEFEEVDSREEFEEMWKRDFPDEKLWYKFSFCEDAQNGYRAICIDHKIVLDTLPDTPSNPYPLDEEKFVQWLTGKIKECIKSIEIGEYNGKVKKELPPDLRFGTITGKAFGEVYPEEQKEYLADLSDTDSKEFLKLMSTCDEKKEPSNLLKEMTAGIFFRGCKLGYAANAYEGSDSLSPKELYLKHADGRDEGLTKIDEESPAAFRKWYHHRKRGGHPWEVCRGGNSTHVALFVSESENGYYFTVAGSSWGRAMETIKFYLALHRAGMPVVIYEGKDLATRLTGEDKIGIVPRGITPRYCESYFPNEKILDFMNLPDEKRDEFVRKCVWRELPEIGLISK